MITLSEVMSRLRAELGLDADEYVPDDLVIAAITEDLRAQEPPESGATSDDGGAPLTR
jgi:hypothetical protein